MKIVSVLGSPRRSGNSTIIARWFCKAAERYGAQTNSFVLNQLTYRGCQGCMQCKGKLDHCALKDDLTDVLNATESADVLVLASPVYYGDVTSQLKGFIDRTFSFLVPDFTTNPKPHRLAPGKKLVFILVQGHPDEDQFADVFPRYAGFSKRFGFDECHLVRACGLLAPGEVESRVDVLRQTEALAQKLCAR